MKTPDESRSVGRISKQWGGLLREALTDSDDFGLQFPMDLDMRMKAVLLGATFLIVSWLRSFVPTGGLCTSCHPDWRGLETDLMGGCSPDLGCDS